MEFHRFKRVPHCRASKGDISTRIYRVVQNVCSLVQKWSKMLKCFEECDVLRCRFLPGGNTLCNASSSLC
jgi:hypothetical protein